MSGALLLVGVMGLIGVALDACLRAIDRPHLWPAGLLLMTAPLEVYRTDLGPFNVSVFRMALPVAATAIVIAFWQSRRRGPTGRLGLAPPFVPYLVLIFLQVVSIAVLTTAPSLGSKFLLQYVAGLVAAAIVALSVRRDDLEACCSLMLASAAMPALASVWRVLGGDASSPRSLPGLELLPIDAQLSATRTGGSYLLDGTERAQGTFADPNHFAFFIALVLLVSAGLAASRLVHSTADERPQRFTLLACCGITAVLLIATYSRSAWLLVAIGCVLLLAFAGQIGLRAIVTRRRLVVAGVSGLILLVAALPIVVARVDPSVRGNAVSNEIHSTTMRLAVELGVDHPLQGVGLGAYGSYADQPSLVSSAHSTLLTTFAELGFPGILALLAAMVTTVYFAGLTLRRQFTRPRDRWCGAGLLAAYSAMAVANIGYEVWADDFQWVTFGLVIGLLIPQRVSVPHPRLGSRRASGRLA